MKTDKSIIADLPDKTEVRAFCGLSKRQAVLYEKSVSEMAEALDRFSRDQEHTAKFYNWATYNDVKLITLSEG